MLFSLFLFVQNPLSSDAHACINGMEEAQNEDAEMARRIQELQEYQEKWEAEEKAQQQAMGEAERAAVPATEKDRLTQLETAEKPQKRRHKPQALAQKTIQTTSISSCDSSGGFEHSFWLVCLALLFSLLRGGRCNSILKKVEH